MTKKIIHIEDAKRDKLNKISLDVAIELINQDLLDYCVDEEFDEYVLQTIAPFVLLSGYRRLVNICRSVLEADERGQGINYQESMKAMAKEIKYRSMVDRT